VSEHPPISEQRAYELLEAAASHFQKALAGKPEAMAYVGQQRGISPALVREFRIGYADGGTGGLLLALKATPEELKAIGLLRSREKGGLNVVFRNRVMFPITDREGRVAGFGGRIIDQAAAPDAPKYLNSPEGDYFKKRELLYGLRRLPGGLVRQIILVEGYVDVIAFAETDLPPALAGLGTALTPEHAALLRQRAESVLLMYDGDDAGRKAAKDAMGTLLDAGFASAEIRVLLLPTEHDPDTWAKAMPADVRRRAIEQAPTAIEWLELQLQGLSKAAMSLERRVHWGEAFVGWIQRMQDPDDQARLLGALAQFLGVEVPRLAEWFRQQHPPTDKPPVISQFTLPEISPARGATARR
jgi:DNA primase